MCCVKGMKVTGKTVNDWSNLILDDATFYTILQILPRSGPYVCSAQYATSSLTYSVHGLGGHVLYNSVCYLAQ